MSDVTPSALNTYGLVLFPLHSYWVRLVEEILYLKKKLVKIIKIAYDNITL